MPAATGIVRARISVQMEPRRWSMGQAMIVRARFHLNGNRSSRLLKKSVNGER
jgi:hypothetical protein